MNMRRFQKTFVISLAIAAAGLLIGWGIVSSKGTKPAADRPELFLETDFYNWGDVGNREPITKSFTVENRGRSDLLIKNIASSCMCTSASLKTAAGETPFMGMTHGGPAPKINVKLKPGEKGELIVRYDPLAHGRPDVGLLRRAVYLRTNDPLRPEAELRLLINAVP